MNNAKRKPWQLSNMQSASAQLQDQSSRKIDIQKQRNMQHATKATYEKANQSYDGYRARSFNAIQSDVMQSCT